ncbi:MAG: 4Fe-4S dicluster domain-containing protein [Provencibacterium sp.]|jgi:carbon-monoxide dehydrogenase iron sulfur subunit|nr:4Fe-4S dicluster domain-containing protein [Provencibacterium sp.]
MKRIFIDPKKCDGCKNCSLACMESHRKDGQTGIYTLQLQDPENQSRNRILSDGKGGYLPIFCRHCDIPDCAGACMSGALQKNMENGLVEYNADSCAACYMCVMSCRYGVPAISPDRRRMIKCDFCTHLPEGPACVRACPKKAIEVREV